MALVKQYSESKISPLGLSVLKNCPFLNKDLQIEWEQIAGFLYPKMDHTIDHTERQEILYSETADKE